MKTKPRNPQWLIARVLLVLVGIAIVLPVQAQTGGDGANGRYSFAFAGVPVSDALGTLIDETDISLIFESDIVAGKTTFCRANRLRLDEVLNCILDGTGLDYIRLSSGTYIIVPSSRSEALLGSVSGMIRDADTGDPIEGANVVLVTGDVGAASNQAGRFTFSSITSGPHVLAVSHISYEARLDSLYVRPSQNSAVTFSLNKRTFLSEPLVVSTTAYGSDARRHGSDLIGDIELLDLNPVATLNVLQVVDQLEGVALGGSLSSVHMQGSASGEHVYRLDGVRIFVPIRLGGLIGPFSPFAIGQINVQKAGFGAQAGSQLAGIVDLGHLITPETDRRVDFQIDPMSVNARVSGRAVSRSGFRASWMLAARRDVQFRPFFDRLDHIMDRWSEPDFFLVDELRSANGLEPLEQDTKDRIAFRRHNYNVGFTDLHAASRLELDAFNSVRISFYHNRNLFSENIDYLEATDSAPDSEERYKWENTAGHLRYEGILSGRTLVDAGVWISSYHLNDTFGDFPIGHLGASSCDTVCTDPAIGDDFNEVGEIGFGGGIQYAASLRHSLTARVEAMLTSSDFGLTLQPNSAPVQAEILQDPVQWRFAGVLEDVWSLSRATSIRIGTRLTYIAEREAVYAEPRFSFEGRMITGQAGSVSIAASAGLYRQFSHQVDVTTYNVNALFPSIRFWMPLDRSQSPPSAVHFSLGLTYEPVSGLSISTDGYVKSQSRIYVLNYGGKATGEVAVDTSEPSLLTAATGIAFGIGVSARYETHVIRIDGRYEHGRSERRIPNRFDGENVASPWDAPHSVLAALEVRALEPLVFSLRYQAVYGRPWGFRRAYYDYFEEKRHEGFDGGFDLSDPASHVLPVFSQLDAGVTMTLSIGAVDVQARVHILNLLNRRNVRDWSLQRTGSGSEIQRQSRPGLPLLPMFSLRLGV